MKGKKNLQACGKHVYGQEMWILEKAAEKNKKLFFIAKSAYYTFWADVRLPKCSSMTSVVHGLIQPSCE
jgi:hypothetical protein